MQVALITASCCAATIWAVVVVVVVACCCCIPYRLALMLSLTFVLCILTFVPCVLTFCTWHPDLCTLRLWCFPFFTWYKHFTCTDSACHQWQLVLVVLLHSITSAGSPLHCGMTLCNLHWRCCFIQPLVQALHFHSGNLQLRPWVTASDFWPQDSPQHTW